MTKTEAETVLKPFFTENGLDFGYIKFDSGPPSTEEYGVYCPEGHDVFGADNKVWFYDGHFRIELYTPIKETDTQEKLLKYLTDNEVFWSTDDSIIFIPEEEMYEYIIHI